MKRIPPWLIFILILVILIIVKILFFQKKQEGPPPAGAGPQQALAVSYFVVKPDTINRSISATGKVGAFNAVDLVPEAAGKVAAIYFSEGDEVKKGTLLVKLNDADLQAQLVKTRDQLKLSQQKLSRLKKLLDVKGVSEEEFQMQENELSSLKADEAYILAQIAKTSIVAPFDGVAGLRNISEGAFVNATVPVVSLVQMRPLYVEFAVPERYHADVKKGTTILFSAEGGPEAIATVFAVEPRVDEATKTLRARAKYEGKEEFYPGSFVNVKVDLGRINNALLIPTQCVVPTMKGQKVFVSRMGAATEATVATGMRTEDRIQIVEGLQPGDTVITTGLLSVRKDMKVRLTTPAH